MAETLTRTRERPRPLIYRPPPRWYFWTAVGGALAIHLAAVVLSQRHDAPRVFFPPHPPQVVEATLAPPEATPPPEDIPIPEPPPPPEIQPEFVEERTPPPKQQTTAKFTPVKARVQCRCRERKPSRYMRRVPSTRTRRGRGTSPGVE